MEKDRPTGRKQSKEEEESKRDNLKVNMRKKEREREKDKQTDRQAGRKLEVGKREGTLLLEKVESASISSKESYPCGLS